jgi:hypothetical protein
MTSDAIQIQLPLLFDAVSRPIIEDKKLRRRLRPVDLSRVFDLFEWTPPPKKEIAVKEKKPRKKHAKKSIQRQFDFETAPAIIQDARYFERTEYSFCDSGDYERFKEIKNKRIRQMKVQVTVLAMLKEGWTTTMEIASVIGCTYRAAKNLLRWARVHYFVEEEEEEKYDDDVVIDGVNMNVRLGIKFRLKDGLRMRREVRLAPCKYACCRDFKVNAEVTIKDFGHVKHMWLSEAPELNERSAVSVDGMHWHLIGKNPPIDVVNEDEAIKWVINSRSELLRSYAGKIYDE